MSTGVLELRHVCKSYGEVHAVDDVSLTLGPGEFLTLLGPSGSGKTTMLSMIAGLTPPTSGTIQLDGRPLDPLPPYRRDIGVVFQNYALFPHMTVAKNVAFPLEMRRLPRAEIAQMVARALMLIGLPQHGARYPHQLSGGQQQRVAFARAIVFEPRILLMDEPLGALDRRLREQMQMEIVRLHRELQVSIVHVTHDQEEALMMSDRIAVVNRGRLAQIGQPSELYERPATQFVASFVGDANFFSANVIEAGTDYCRLNGGDLLLTARSRRDLLPGSTAVVVIRPERIRLAANDTAAFDAENAVRGVLTEAIYLGRSRKYIVRLQSGQDVTVFEQLAVGLGCAAAPGDDVRLAWHADDATVVPEN